MAGFGLKIRLITDAARRCGIFTAWRRLVEPRSA